MVKKLFKKTNLNKQKTAVLLASLTQLIFTSENPIKIVIYISLRRRHNRLIILENIHLIKNIES